MSAFNLEAVCLANRCTKNVNTGLVKLQITFLDGIFGKTDILSGLTRSFHLIIDVLAPGHDALCILKAHHHRDVGCLKIKITKANFRTVGTGILFDLKAAGTDGKLTGNRALSYAALLGMDRNYLLRKHTAVRLLITAELNILQPFLKGRCLLLCRGFRCLPAIGTGLIKRIVRIYLAFCNAFQITFRIGRCIRHTLDGLLDQITGIRVCNQHCVLGDPFLCYLIGGTKGYDLLGRMIHKCLQRLNTACVHKII